MIALSGRSQRDGGAGFLIAALSSSLLLGLTAALASPGTAIALAAVLPLLAFGLSVALVPPYLGFVYVVALLPLQAFGLLETGFDVRPSYLALLALICGLLVRGFPWLKKLQRHGWLCVFLAVSALSMVFSPPVSQINWDSNMTARASSLRSPLQFGLLLFHFAVFLIAAQFCQSATWRQRFLKVYLGFGGLLAVYGIYQTLAFYFGWPLTDITWVWDPAGSSTVEYGETRLYSAGVVDFAPRATFRESMHFAHYLISFVPLAWALSTSTQARAICGWSRRTLVWITCLGSATLLLTFSRSGWGAAVVAASVLLVGLRSARGLGVLVTCGLGLVGGFAILSAVGIISTDVTLWGLITGRLSTDTLMIDPRLLYFAVFVQSFLAYPWLGLGVGNFALTGGAVYSSTKLHSAHGIFQSAAADSGIFAALSLALFFSTILVRLWRRRLSEEGVLFVGLAAALVGMLAQNLFFGDRPELYLLFIAGVAAASVSIPNESNGEQVDTAAEKPC